MKDLIVLITSILFLGIFVFNLNKDFVKIERTENQNITKSINELEIVDEKLYNDFDYLQDYLYANNNSMCDQNVQYTENQVKKIIRNTAYEMGADPTILYLWSRRESQHTPNIKHTDIRDIMAAIRSWNNFAHSTTKEQQYKEILEFGRSAEKLAARFSLERIETYKNNKFFKDKKRWQAGLGLYAMNPALYVKTWDKNAPPEILCDPIISTATMIWTARNFMGKCLDQGYKPTYEVMNRLLGHGKCRPRQKDKDFKERTEGYRIHYNDRVQLGHKWPEEKTNRVELYLRIKERLSAEQ